MAGSDYNKDSKADALMYPVVCLKGERGQYGAKLTECVIKPQTKTQWMPQALNHQSSYNFVETKGAHTNSDCLHF